MTERRIINGSKGHKPTQDDKNMMTMAIAISDILEEELPKEHPKQIHVLCTILTTKIINAKRENQAYILAHVFSLLSGMYNKAIDVMDDDEREDVAL